MAGKFQIKSRHSTIYYFRWRFPEAAQHSIGRQVFVQLLETSDRRLAVIRGRALAAQTDSIFQCLPEYFSKSQTKAQTKATYHRKLDHAQKNFGDARDMGESTKRILSATATPYQQPCRT